MDDLERLIDRLNRGETLKSWDVDAGALVSALNAGLVELSENCDVELVVDEAIPACA